MGNHIGLTPRMLVAVYPQELATLIGKRAEELSQARGREQGHELDDWLRAETEIIRRRFAVSSEMVADHPQELETLIALRAQELYEARGREEGYELEDWLRAEAEITGRKIVISEPGGGYSSELRRQIGRRAQEFCDARGGEDGHELEDWLRAEAEITGKEIVIIAEAPGRSPELQQRIVQRAQELCDLRGGEEGHDWEDWLQAEAEITAKTPARSPQLEQRIVQRAQELFEARGREDGHQWDDWLQAEAEIMAGMDVTGGDAENAAALSSTVAESLLPVTAAEDLEDEIPEPALEGFEARAETARTETVRAEEVREEEVVEVKDDIPASSIPGSSVISEIPIAAATSEDLEDEIPEPALEVFEVRAEAEDEDEITAFVSTAMAGHAKEAPTAAPELHPTTAGEEITATPIAGEDAVASPTTVLASSLQPTTPSEMPPQVLKDQSSEPAQEVQAPPEGKDGGQYDGGTVTEKAAGNKVAAA